MSDPPPPMNSASVYARVLPCVIDFACNTAVVGSVSWSKSTEKITNVSFMFDLTLYRPDNFYLFNLSLLDLVYQCL